MRPWAWKLLLTLQKKPSIHANPSDTVAVEIFKSGPKLWNNQQMDKMHGTEGSNFNAFNKLMSDNEAVYDAYLLNWIHFQKPVNEVSALLCRKRKCDPALFWMVCQQRIQSLSCLNSDIYCETKLNATVCLDMSQLLCANLSKSVLTVKAIGSLLYNSVFLSSYTCSCSHRPEMIFESVVT